MSYDNKHIETYSESAPAKQHVESETLERTQTLEKTDTADDDVAFKVFTNIHAIADEIDPHAEKRLVRKIDFYVIPFICITYLITYIDKATLSYGMNLPLYQCRSFMLMQSSRSLWPFKGSPSSWNSI